MTKGTPGSAAPPASPWLWSRGVDIPFLLLPPFAATLVALAVAAYAAPAGGTPPWAWLLLIVGVDVAHVYSTFFRTYLNPAERKRRPLLYLVTPLVGWLVGVGLCLTGPMVFWRVLAYVAVFHFVRQQYGFMMIYTGRDGRKPAWSRRLNKAVIYAATIYPLVFWHLHQPRQFNWFVDGDFYGGPGGRPLELPGVEPVAFAVYAGIFAAYAAKELYYLWAGHRFNWPQNLLVLGTAVSWYVGIVVLNQDLAFTITNVVSHGVPYMALIWLTERGDAAKARPPRRGGRRFFTPRLIPLYLGCLALAAYLEEGLWDGLVWRDHATLFSWFEALPQLSSRVALAVVIPTLALPQLTHYLLDGFIWRIRGDGNWLQRVRGVPSA